MGEALGSMGLARDARIAMALPNGPEMAVAFLGITCVATCAPLNPIHQASEFEFFLSDLKADAVIVQWGMDTPLSVVAQKRGIPVIELTPSTEETAGIFSLKTSESLCCDRVRFAGANDLALILYTSGTTARPKRVPLTHANLIRSARNIQTTLALTRSDRCLNMMPLFHIHGLAGALLSSLVAGASVVCAPGFVPSEFSNWLETYRPTWYTAVPPIHQAVLSSLRAKSPVPTDCSLRFIRSCSAALPPAVMRELEETFRVPVIEAYGMTEASHQISSNPLPPGKRKEGSVGLAAGVELSIMDGRGTLLLPGEVGEIVIRGAGVMAGYGNAPDANAESFTNGWFRTGDQGYLDDDGYLFIIGRLKEIINRGAEKISPLEIDQVLLDHPAVAEAVSFGIPHPTLGEEIAAAVVLRKQAEVTEAELRQFVAAHLADFKVPRRIVMVDKIPRGVTGKIQRFGLAEQFAQELRKDLGAPKDALEAVVAAIYTEVLGVENVSGNDNFFVLGGDSLRATQVLSRLRAIFHLNFPIATIFQKATVSELADEISLSLAAETIDD
jgi:acyl-CoA synthetase (AMP-forming)/AMP-acid ligase II